MDSKPAWAGGTAGEGDELLYGFEQVNSRVGPCIMFTDEAALLEASDGLVEAKFHVETM